MDGVTYKPGEVVILELNVVPQFGLIVHIIIEDNVRITPIPSLLRASKAGQYRIRWDLTIHSLTQSLL